MALAKKQTEGIIVDNRVGVAVNDILSDDDANEAFSKIDRNIAGVEWEAEPLDPELPEVAVHIPHINNNQYAALVNNDKNNEDEQENDNERTGVENNGKRTGVENDNESTGVGSDDESTGVKSEPGSMGATDEVDEMGLIEEAISEAEWDITQGTDLLARTEIETDDTRDKNVIHPET